MKQVHSYSITLIPDTNPLDNRYLFRIATDIASPIIIDLAELLKEFRNDRVEFRKDYKLWNDVYPGEKELEIFQGIVEKAVVDGRKVHIINCTLREEVQIIRELYEGLGYFDTKENRFMVPFSEAPVTIGVNIRNLAYSTKDYKSKRESICFIPPPREPGHVKTLFAAVNS
jgi:dihydroorotase-like cyclic amidohydrolase